MNEPSQTLEILDIGNIINIFPITSICLGGDINKAIAIAKRKNKPIPDNLANMDRWLAIKFEYGDQDISNNYALDFLLEYLETRECYDCTIKNIRLGEYEIKCNYMNEPIKLRFKVGTFAPSYLCCRLFGNNPTECFCFIPHKMATTLIDNGSIQLNGKFNWAPGLATIKEYQQIISL